MTAGKRKENDTLAKGSCLCEEVLGLATLVCVANQDAELIVSPVPTFVCYE